MSVVLSLMKGFLFLDLFCFDETFTLLWRLDNLDSFFILFFCFIFIFDGNCVYLVYLTILLGDNASNLIPFYFWNVAS